MSNFTDLVDRYIAIWNETDDKRRRDLIARTWTEDSTYLDPMVRGEGRGGIDAMIRGVQAQFPGLLFRRTSDVDAHNDRVRFDWELGPEGGPALAGGVDFGVIVGDRLQRITGFLDFAPKPAG
jgi:SnoaL-like domain